MRPLIFVLALSTGLAAQQLQTAIPTAPRQPIPQDTLVVANAPLRPAVGWALTPNGDVTADGVVSAQGSGLRIASTTDLTAYRPTWSLTGPFTFGALFESAQPAATYGLTVGGASGLALLVRTDGAFSVQPMSGGKPTGGAWTRLPLRTTAAGAPAANRLEVQVRGTEVRCLINSQLVHTMAVRLGQFDGVPGVYAGAGADVVVAGFTIERPPSPQGVR